MFQAAVRSTALSHVFLLLACGGDPSLSATSLPIVNGENDHGNPSVGALERIDRRGASLCTATLVGDRTVLTAAHCVDPRETHVFHVAGHSFTARRVVRHPDFVPNKAPGIEDTDIAVVLLAESPPVTPSAIAVDEPLSNEAVTIVGFGSTGTLLNTFSEFVEPIYVQDGGTKRTSSNVIDEVFGVQFSVDGDQGGSTCSGDSGGPAFTQLGRSSVVSGITSWGLDVCGEMSFFVRVDRFSGWLSDVSGGDVELGFVDDTAPRLTVTTPWDMANVDQEVQVVAQAVDDVAIERVELWINGQLFTQRARPPYTFQILLSPGVAELHLVAYDTSQNRSETSVRVIVGSPGQPNVPSQPLGPRQDLSPEPAFFTPERPASSSGCRLGGTSAPPALPLLLLALSVSCRLRKRRFGRVDRP